MSRDSSRTYIHLHSPRLADLFEEFITPPNPLLPANASTMTGNTTTNATLPYEEIYIPPHLQPPNPEDEEDVVPDQHAAFGIARALAARERERTGAGGEGRWRDFESLADLVSGVGLGEKSERMRDVRCLR